MAVNTTLLGIVNQGLKVIGEPEITAFTSTNILQQHLIEAVNDAVDSIRERYDFDWTIAHTQLVTAAEITDGTVTVTASDATVTNSGTNFSSAEANMWFRLTSEEDSYVVSSVDSSSSIELTNTYQGSTATEAGYSIFKDVYSLSITNLDQVQHMAYGDARNNLLGHQVPDSNIKIVTIDDIMQFSGGDIHRDSGGSPRYAARISPDSSDIQRYLFWPAPRAKHLIQVWYDQIFATITATSAAIFGGDAPRIALSAVAHKVKAAAHLWDKQSDQADVELQQFDIAVGQLIRRENRAAKDTSFQLETYRRQYGITFPARSGILFDIKSAQR